MTRGGQDPRVAEDLARSRHFLDAVIENIPDMVFVKEAESLSFVHLNGAGERLLGVVTREELDEHKGEEGVRVCEIIADQDLLSVFPETSIHDAANKMVARNLRQVPVVSPDNPHKMLGWLTLNDIARQQNAAGG